MFRADSDPMQSPRFQPLTFGMILDRTIHLYLHNFLLLFGIMVLPHGLNYANQIVFTRSLEWGAPAATAAYVAVYALIYLLTLAAGTGAATVAISSRYLSRDISVLAAYRQTVRRIGTIMRAWAVAGILIILVMVGCIAGAVIVATLLELVLAAYLAPLFVFMPLFLLAAVLFTGRMVAAYCLITPVIILENCSARESRRRSRFLTRRVRFGILGILLLYVIVISLLSYGALALVNLVTGTPQSVLLTGKLTVFHHLVSAPLQFLFAPVPAILAVLIYYSQRMRKEGFDLVLLADALVASPENHYNSGGGDRG